MKANQWNFDIEKNYFTLTFKDPFIEATYRSIRESRVIMYYPKIFFCLICIVLFLRRLMLMIEALAGTEGLNKDKEILLTLIAFLTLILESLCLCVDRFIYFRCTFLIICNFYLAADSSITYYISRVPNEPVYSFRLLII